MNSRVQILDFPQAHPGKCALCGSQTNRDGRKYIDFGLSVPHYGAIVFCSHCLGEINKALDWAPPSQVHAWNDTLKEVKSSLDKAREENGRLRSALGNLDFLGSNGSSNAGPVGAVQEDDGKQGSSDNKSVDVAKRRAEAKARSAKPSNVGRSKDVSDPELAKLLQGSL